MPPRPGIADFQENLRRVKVQSDIILYYYVGDTESFLFVVADEEVNRSAPLGVSPADAKILFADRQESSRPLTCSLAVRLVEQYVEYLQRDVLPGRHQETRGEPASSGGSVEKEAGQRSQGGMIKVSSDWFLPRNRRCRPPGSEGPELRPFGHEQALALTRILLPPWVFGLAETERYEHVAIVADPALQRLPFQALPVEPVKGEAEGSEYVLDHFRFIPELDPSGD